MQDFAERLLATSTARVYLSQIHGPRSKQLFDPFSSSGRSYGTTPELLGNGVRPSWTWSLPLGRQLYVYMRPYTTASRYRAGHTSPNRDPRGGRGRCCCPPSKLGAVSTLVSLPSFLARLDRKIWNTVPLRAVWSHIAARNRAFFPANHGTKYFTSIKFISIRIENFRAQIFQMCVWKM